MLKQISLKTPDSLES